ncbi:hypothetical protein ACFFQW_39600 [Umezawaea endophytica]|uniref:Uncharacterized protein n=1 Tax=Umezawaea endophytica TaxID=1654476 RepID=A0A9X2VV91_9PSEU|nr:hypothetical protein [Umezawaea endophytica]MCS7483468.1 hypothetical protein [Umezawaea endophytica]
MAEDNAVPPGQPVPVAETVALRPNFTTIAQADLDSAHSAVAAVDRAVDTGKIALDKGSADELIKAIADARDRVQDLYDAVRDQLDIPLQFGDNWVGRSISRRLREVAVGDQESAVFVIREFMDVLEDVEATVRQAAKNTEDHDEDLAHTMGGKG